MAHLMVSPDGTRCALELTNEEYEVVRRALHKAFERAVGVGATADQDNLMRLLEDLGHPQWTPGLR